MEIGEQGGSNLTDNIYDAIGQTLSAENMQDNAATVAELREKIAETERLKEQLRSIQESADKLSQDKVKYQKLLEERIKKEEEENKKRKLQQKKEDEERLKTAMATGNGWNPAQTMIQKLQVFTGESDQDPDTFFDKMTAILSSMPNELQRRFFLLDYLDGAALACAKELLAEDDSATVGEIIEELNKEFKDKGKHSKEEKKKKMKLRFRKPGETMTQYLLVKKALLRDCGITADEKRNYWILLGLGQKYVNDYGESIGCETNNFCETLKKKDEIERRFSKDLLSLHGKPTDHSSISAEIQRTFEENGKEVERIKTRIAKTEEPEEGEQATEVMIRRLQTAFQPHFEKLEKLEKKFNNFQSKKQPTDKSAKPEKWCEHHKSKSHNTSDCRALHQKGGPAQQQQDQHHGHPQHPGHQQPTGHPQPGWPHGHHQEGHYNGGRSWGHTGNSGFQQQRGPVICYFCSQPGHKAFACRAGR